MRSDINIGKAVQLADGATALAAPATVADMVATKATFGANHPPRSYALAIFGSGTGTITGAALYGYLAVLGKIVKIGNLNQSQTISLTAAIGHVEPGYDLGLFSHLKVAGTVTGGIEVDIYAIPVTALEQ